MKNRENNGIGIFTGVVSFWITLLIYLAKDDIGWGWLIFIFLLIWGIVHLITTDN